MSKPLTDNYSPELAISSRHTSGVYAIHLTNSDKWYIGSSVDVHRRLEQHYHSSNGALTSKSSIPLYSLVKQEGWDNFDWGLVTSTNNYVEIFLSQHNGEHIDAYTNIVLTYHTQYEIRLIEQSIITGVGAELNSGNVLFSHHWSPDINHFQSQARPFTAEVISGPNAGAKYPMSSINEGARILGIKQINLYVYINSSTPIHSEFIDAPIRVYEEGLELNKTNPILRTPKLFAVTPIDYDELTLNRIFAYD